MKSFTSFFLFALVCLTSFVVFIPASSSNLEPRYYIPGNCRDKYRGNLIVNTGNADRTKYVQVGKLGNPEYLAWKNEIATQFIFQECQIEGWNAPPQEHGHLIIQSEGNSSSFGASDKLYFDKATYQVLSVPTQTSAKNEDLLARQWFYANYLQSPNGSPSVELSLYGNPNDDSCTFQAPHVVLHSDGTVAVDNVVTEAYYDRFRLVDVEIVTIKPMVNNKATTNEIKCKQDLFAGKQVDLSSLAQAQFAELKASGTGP